MKVVAKAWSLSFVFLWCFLFWLCDPNLYWHCQILRETMHKLQVSCTRNKILYQPRVLLASSFLFSRGVDQGLCSEQQQASGSTTANTGICTWNTECLRSQWHLAVENHHTSAAEQRTSHWPSSWLERLVGDSAYLPTSLDASDLWSAGLWCQHWWPSLGLPWAQADHPFPSRRFWRHGWAKGQWSAACVFAKWLDCSKHWCWWNRLCWQWEWPGFCFEGRWWRWPSGRRWGSVLLWYESGLLGHCEPSHWEESAGCSLVRYSFRI